MSADTGKIACPDCALPLTRRADILARHRMSSNCLGQPLPWYQDKPAEPIGKRATWNLAMARVNGVTWIYRNRQWVSPEEVTR